MNQFKKLLFLLIIGGFTCCVISWSFPSLELHHVIEHVPFNRELRVLLRERLLKVDTSPYAPHESSQRLDGIIYVMGGSQKSLLYRFKTAADIYHTGIGDKLLVLSVPGITEYDHRLGRNLTNDEWAIARLIEFGVKKQDIKFVPAKKMFFGTLSEAKTVSNTLSHGNIKRLIVVSSSYHTMRTWITFSKIITSENVSLYICGSNEPVNLEGLFSEYFKLISYKYIILPIYRHI